MKNKTEPTTDFEEWIAGLNLEDDYDDVHSLFKAVSERDSYGMFSCKTNGERTDVSCEAISDQTLILASEKARDAFINFLENRFGGDLGIDGQYEYNKAMEKAD